jgi:ATP-dependent RNA helicase RhlB
VEKIPSKNKTPAVLSARPEEKPAQKKPALEQQENRQRQKRSGNRKPKWKAGNFAVEPVSGKSRFHDFDLPVPLMHGIADLDFKYCTPIQEKALPHVLAGKDIIGKASTGTGKSAVFLIGIFSRLLREKNPDRRKGWPRALIIAPTRELVIQIAKDARVIAKYLHLRVAEAYGGTDYERQRRNITDRPVDILVATPGRLLDFSRQRFVQLGKAGIMVIDEADRMLDMGFIPDVRSIIYKTPPKEKRQTMLFSATFTDEVKRLAAQWSTNSVTVETETEEIAVKTVKKIVYMVSRSEKYLVLYNIITREEHERVLIFANMKRDVNRLYDRLRRDGINCTMLSGDVPQNKRTTRLENFRSGRIQILVATDVAGRGIHIDGISHVINYTLPYEPEDYVHRIGRTGRAGEEGISISFADEESSFYLPEIEEYIEEQLPCIQPDESLLTPLPRRKQQGNGKRKKK